MGQNSISNLYEKETNFLKVVSKGEFYDKKIAFFEDKYEIKNLFFTMND